MIRAAARAALLALLVAGLILSAVPVAQIMADPRLSPMTDRPAAAFRAAVAAQTARMATEGRVAALLSARLAEAPRNWLVIDALLQVAGERGLPLHPQLVTRIEAARDEDGSLIALAGGCLACAVDTAECGLETALICNAPITLSPVGDVIGLGREGWNWATGAEVDDLDLALSAIGLGATALALATGGSSLTLKAGASTLRMARKLRLLSAPFTDWLRVSASAAFDMRALRGANDLGDLGRVLRPGAFGPVARLAGDLAAVNTRLGPTETLHLLRYVDGPDDAARLARSAEAMGPKLLGRIEILGKTRLWRLGLRLSDTALRLAGGLAALLAALTALGISLAQTVSLRLARRLLRRLAA